MHRAGRLFRALSVLFACSSVHLWGQAPLIDCTITAEGPLLRSGGHAERLGDIRLACTGGDPNQVRFLNLVVFVNAGITSRIVDPATGETEALLLIDDPLPGVPNTSNGVVYQGQVKGTPGVLPGPPGNPGAPGSGNVYAGFQAVGGENRIEWNGIPFRPPQPGQNRILRLVNIRIDAQAQPVDPNNPMPVTVEVAVTASNSVPLGTSRVVAGYITPAAKSWVERPSGQVTLVYKEGFTEAFRKRIATSTAGATAAVLQATPEFAYFTESGFTPEFGSTTPGAPGAASTGTRLIAEFRDLPPGVFLVAPASVRSELLDGSPGELEARRVVGFGPDLSGGELLASGGPWELVPVNDGRALLVYEVVPVAPYAGVNGALVIDRFRIPVDVVFPQPASVGGASVVLGLGPWDATAEMSATAPAPRFSPPDPGGVFFPVIAAPTLDYLTLRFTPSDETPLVVTREFGSAVVDGSLSVIAGGEWLSASALRPPDEETVEFVVRPEDLEPGRYYGAVALRLASDPNSLVIVPVVLDVNPPPEIMLDTSQILFRTSVDGPAPPPQQRFLNGRNKWLDYTVTVETASGGPWLTVTPQAGRTPVYLQIEADPSGLAPGRYEGTITVQADTAVNSPQVIPVLFEVTPPLPVFEATAVVNAASYAGGGVAPGELVTIFGENIGPEEPAGAVIGPDGKLSTVTGGTRILFDGIPAPMIAASRRQSTCVVPFEIRGRDRVMVQVEVDGWLSSAVSIPVLETKPGVFSADSSGRGQGAILNEDGTLNTPENPAPVGSVITLFLTGAGEMSPPGVDGSINPAADPPVPLAPAVVRIGGVEAQVEFLGGAPGLVAGVVQINVRAPATPGDQVPVQVLFAGRSSNIVYVSVAR